DADGVSQRGEGRPVPGRARAVRPRRVPRAAPTSTPSAGAGPEPAQRRVARVPGPRSHPGPVRQPRAAADGVGAPAGGGIRAAGARERSAGAGRPSGDSCEWTRTALQEKAASGGTAIVLGLAILFAYLFLVALYESWNIPLPALLSVSVAVLGAIVAVVKAGLGFDVDAQRGGARRMPACRENRDC